MVVDKPISPKETLYKTAYSPLFKCYVRINHVHRADSIKDGKRVSDGNGHWIFTCSNEKEGLSEHLFSEHELTNFCL